VPELADGLDLGSSAARRGGSSPPFPTNPLITNFSNPPSPNYFVVACPLVSPLMLFIG
jgi:hypothetical protein